MIRSLVAERSVPDWSVMALSAGSRVALSVAFAAFAAVSLPDADSAGMFQLLFLQGGLIALLSASAYARGAHLASVVSDASGSISSFLQFLGIGVAVSFAAAAVFLPVPGVSLPVRLLVLGMMVIGAAGAALNGLLQGLTVVRRGVLPAFLPILLVSLLGCALIAVLWGPRSYAVVTAVWVAPQLIPPLVLIVGQQRLRAELRLFRAPIGDRSDGFGATGVSNAASVGVAYVYRERWSSSQIPAHAADGFFIVRLTEVGYQVIYMVLASVPRWVRHVMDRLFGEARRALLLGISAFATLLGLGPCLLDAGWAFGTFLFAELLVAPARLLTTFCLLFLLGQDSTRGYQIAVLLATASTIVLMFVGQVQGSAYALQAFRAIGLIPTAAVVFVALRGRWER